MEKLFKPSVLYQWIFARLAASVFLVGFGLISSASATSDERQTDRAKTYYGNKPRYTVEKAVTLTKHLKDNGILVTWDVPIMPDGRLVDAFIPTLKAMAEVMAEDPLELREEGKIK